jgi:hypothetical protein
MHSLASHLAYGPGVQTQLLSRASDRLFSCRANKILGRSVGPRLALGLRPGLGLDLGPRKDTNIPSLFSARGATVDPADPPFPIRAPMTPIQTSSSKGPAYLQPAVLPPRHQSQRLQPSWKLPSTSNATMHAMRSRWKGELARLLSTGSISRWPQPAPQLSPARVVFECTFS